MKPLKFSIQAEAMDCYIYAGNLFIILQDGRLGYIPFNHIMHQLYSKYDEFVPILKLAFNRNDYFSSEAGKLFLAIPEVKKTLQDVWDKTSEEPEFILDWDDVSDGLIIIDNINSPVLDMRAYATNLYLGCENGLYESKLKLDNKGYTISPTKPKHKFDAKVVSLNSGYGNVIISSGENGLFNAPLDENTFSIKVNEIPDSPVSYRTGWSSSDLLNYEDFNSFEYLVNEVRKVEKSKERRIPHSRIDNRREGKIITKFGAKKHGMNAMLGMDDYDKSKIIYAFNSSQSSFIFTKDTIYIINLRERTNNNVHMSSLANGFAPIERKYMLRPISACVVPAGCVVEYMDSVMLYQNKIITELEQEPTFSVRSFMNSLRYRYLVATTKMNEITIHSIEPFDTYLHDPAKRKEYIPTADILKDAPSQKPKGTGQREELPF